MIPAGMVTATAMAWIRPRQRGRQFPVACINTGMCGTKAPPKHSVTCVYDLQL